MSVRSVVRRHSTLTASIPAGVMFASLLLSVAGVLAIHLSLTDLILWPAVGSFVVSGWVLAARRPENAVGWLLLLTAVGLSFLPWTVLSLWMIQDGLDLGRWTGGLSGAAFVFDVGGLGLLLPLTFPDGRLPSGRKWWRVVLWADLLYMVFAVANLFDTAPLSLAGRHVGPNPWALPHDKTLVSVLISMCVPCLMIGFVGSFASLIVRWRRADATQRAQMKWVILALLLAPLPFILHDWWLAGSDVLMVVILPLVPIAVAVSVLRYRLYEIDRVLSRTVAYLLVTGVLVGGYVGAVAITDRVLGFSSEFAVAASTLAAAALFRPLVRRVQRSVDRRFNRERYDAARTVDAFAVRLRDEVDADVVRADLLAVAAKAMQPSTMSLWVTR
jgi:hypothetical protein